VKTIPVPRGNKKKYFAKAQEACRKDVEQAFEVLQSHFATVRGPARLWDEDTLGDIMMACTIRHSMIVEDERDLYIGEYDCNYDDMGECDINEALELDAFMKNYKNKETHTQLQVDLIEHL
jgi:glutathione S-transferase